MFEVLILSVRMAEVLGCTLIEIGVGLTTNVGGEETVSVTGIFTVVRPVAEKLSVAV